MSVTITPSDEAREQDSSGSFPTPHARGPEDVEYDAGYAEGIRLSSEIQLPAYASKHAVLGFIAALIRQLAAAQPRAAFVEA